MRCRNRSSRGNDILSLTFSGYPAFLLPYVKTHLHFFFRFRLLKFARALFTPAFRWRLKDTSFFYCLPDIVCQELFVSNRSTTVIALVFGARLFLNLAISGFPGRDVRRRIFLNDVLFIPFSHPTEVPIMKLQTQVIGQHYRPPLEYSLIMNHTTMQYSYCHKTIQVNIVGRYWLWQTLFTALKSYSSQSVVKPFKRCCNNKYVILSKNSQQQKLFFSFLWDTRLFDWETAILFQRPCESRKKKTLKCPNKPDQTPNAGKAVAWLARVPGGGFCDWN